MEAWKELNKIRDETLFVCKRDGSVHITKDCESFKSFNYLGYAVTRKFCYNIALTSDARLNTFLLILYKYFDAIVDVNRVAIHMFHDQSHTLIY